MRFSARSLALSLNGRGQEGEGAGELQRQLALNLSHQWRADDHPQANTKPCRKNSVFITVENIIDAERRENAFGLMMSLNMLIEFGDAFDFSGPEFWSWCHKAGFNRYEVHLAGLAAPESRTISEGSKYFVVTSGTPLVESY